MRLRMSSMSGSGAFDDVAQIDWFGQPSQALALPASAEAVPGQCSGASAGVLLIELTTIISSIISHLVWLPRSEGHACTACRRHLHHACLRRRTHAFITSSPSSRPSFERHTSQVFFGFVFLPIGMYRSLILPARNTMRQNCYGPSPPLPTRSSSRLVSSWDFLWRALFRLRSKCQSRLHCHLK